MTVRRAWSSSTNALRSASNVAHLGVDLVGDAVDRDEQRELAVPQRVEDLAVVVARAHASRRRSRAAGRRGRRPCATSSRTARRIRAIGTPASSSERDHAQRDEVAERVRAAGRRPSGTTSPMRRHASSCAVVQPGEPGGLDRGVAHRRRTSARRSATAGLVVGPSARASACPALPSMFFERAAAHRAGEALDARPGRACARCARWRARRRA